MPVRHHPETVLNTDGIINGSAASDIVDARSCVITAQDNFSAAVEHAYKT